MIIKKAEGPLLRHEIQIWGCIPQYYVENVTVVENLFTRLTTSSVGAANALFWIDKDILGTQVNHGHLLKICRPLVRDSSHIYIEKPFDICDLTTAVQNCKKTSSWPWLKLELIKQGLAFSGTFLKQ